MVPPAQLPDDIIAQKHPAEAPEKASILPRLAIIALAAALAYLVYTFLPYEVEPRKGLALLTFIAILWLTEALHITITALLIPALAVIIGFEGLTTAKALSTFADPVIFLFFGGFALATALHAQKLDQKIALSLVSAARGRMGIATLYIFLATAGLSMWISNTATAAMMLPLALGLISQMSTDKRGTKTFIMLGIAYSASVGGLGTLVGSPPNIIAARALDINFAEWMKIGLPMMFVMLPVVYAILYLMFRPDFGKRVSGITVSIPWTTSRITAIILFAATALCWIFSSKIAAVTKISSMDTVIALSAAILVVSLGLASWKEVSANTDWGVLYLFGGGLTLSAILRSSGASAVLGNAVAGVMGGLTPFFVCLIVALFIVFLTEFTSNTASAALLVPVFAAIAEQMNMPKELLVLIIGIGASLAFMMPVATPPNALVFGTGHVRQRDMIKVGFILEVVGAIILATYAVFFL
ncbi:MAG: SLC13 family permease [Desulfobulbus sp.]|jgi:sodium-dependent dicarboxylate transporter 2/3/5